MSHTPALALRRPAAGEYDPDAGGYVALAPDITDALPQFTQQRDAVAGRFSSMTETVAGYRYAPGKWTVRELLGHICDAERIFAYRLLRIARGDQTPLSGFDENTYVPAGAFESRTIGDLVSEWTVVRDATIALLRGIPADGWARRGVANGKNVTVPALAYIMVGHVEHHLRILKDRYGL